MALKDGEPGLRSRVIVRRPGYANAGAIILAVRHQIDGQDIRAASSREEVVTVRDRFEQC